MNESAARSAILDAAEALLAEEGPAGIGFPELATKAGLGTAAIRLHFQSMAEVFREALDRLAGEFRRAQEVTPAGSCDPTTWMLSFLREMTGVIQRHIGLFHLLVTGPSRARSEYAGLFCTQVRDLLGPVLCRVRGSVPLIEQDREIAAMFGPALACLMASHFLFRPLLEAMRVGPLEESFYRKYPQVIADLAATGIFAVVFNAKLGKYGPRDGEDGNMG